MSEMVERVAKAIAALDEMEWDTPDIHSEFFRMQARAAIDAMREPTDDMRHYGWEAADRADKDIVASECWRAMIDEALKP